MAELRQIPFKVSYYGNACSVISMTSEDGQHVAKPDWTASPDDVWIDCSCKQRWRIPRKKASDEEIEATFNSHLCYFNRPQTKVD